MGRNLFVKNGGYNLDTDTFTVKEFIDITRNAFGGDVIRRLEEKNEGVNFMPKVYLTFAERERANFEKERDRQIDYLSGVIAKTKYTIPAREIESKIKGSRTVIAKVRNNPIKATLEQLFDYCYATGKKVTITIE